VTGIAAPLFDSAIIGSLSVTLGSASLGQVESEQICERVKFCAGIVTQTISRPPALGSGR
jgi:hypothetical protein